MHLSLAVVLAITRVRFQAGAVRGLEASAVVRTAVQQHPTEAKRLEWLQIPEVARWAEQPAVQAVWRQSFDVTMFPGASAEARAVQLILGHEVPGLGGVTFGDVFAALEAADCPVWIVGGTVRDVLAGQQPHDVDTAILCGVDTVEQLCEDRGWAPYRVPTDTYFSIGEKEGNDEYLEGFTLPLVMSDWSMPEFTASILFWSVRHAFVLDPTGRGLADARNRLLRPAAPAPDAVVGLGNGDATGVRLDTEWKVWREWVLGGFGSPVLARHVRYLKMRMRGWQPATECVRLFMANQMLVLWKLEMELPASHGLMLIDMPEGETWGVYNMATLQHLYMDFHKTVEAALAVRPMNAGRGWALELARGLAAKAASLLQVAAADLGALHAADDAQVARCTGGRAFLARTPAVPAEAALPLSLEATLVGPLQAAEAQGALGPLPAAFLAAWHEQPFDRSASQARAYLEKAADALEEAAAVNDREHAAAATIQAVWRGRQARLAKLKDEAATKIQLAWRGLKEKVQVKSVASPAKRAKTTNASS